MLMSTTLTLSAALMGAAFADDTAWRTTQPAPLAARPFQLPEATRGTLSNGLEVVVVENHEAPLVYVDLILNAGKWTEPDGATGLASVTLAMLSEGAAGMDAAALSVAQRRLGASISAGAGTDSATIRMSTLSRTLAPSLDLLQKIALEPEFPEDSWAILQKKRIQDLQASRQTPDAVAARIWAHVNYGDQYRGKLSSEAQYEAMTTDGMRAWYQASVRPENAILLVGGDTTLDEVRPLLEARFGSWSAEGDAPAVPTPTAPSAAPSSRIYLHAIDGAPQSVIRIGGFVNPQVAPDRTALALANQAWGGQFSARLNMNLREKEGWTYGARAGIADNQLPGLWQASASVMATATDDAVIRILELLDQSRSDAPITEAELDYVRTGLLGSWPLDFEQPGHLLGEHSSMWRYGLPDDWITGYPDRLRAVTVDAANAAWKAHIPRENLTIVIVGDPDELKPGIEALGLPIIEVDGDGKVLKKTP